MYKRAELTVPVICGILAFSAAAFGKSAVGFSAYKAISSPVTVAAGLSATNVAAVIATPPADGSLLFVTAYRAVVFATGGSADTTLRILFPGRGEESPAMTIPANRTVALVFEAMQRMNHPRTPIRASMTLVVGASGEVTIQPSTSLTLEGMPVYASERNVDRPTSSASAYWPAASVNLLRLGRPFTLPADATVARLLQFRSQLPDYASPTLSVIQRAVIYVTAGTSPTTCHIGIAGGVVTSPPITLPANVTVPIFVEDTGGPQSPGSIINFPGIVVTAGSGGPIILQSASSFSTIVMPTENAVY